MVIGCLNDQINRFRMCKKELILPIMLNLFLVIAAGLSALIAYQAIRSEKETAEFWDVTTKRPGQPDEVIQEHASPYVLSSTISVRSIKKP